MILGHGARGPVSQTRQVIGTPFSHGARPPLIPSSEAAFSLLCPLVHNKSSPSLITLCVVKDIGLDKPTPAMTMIAYV